MKRAKKIFIGAVVILTAALLFLGYRFFKAVKDLDSYDNDMSISDEVPDEILHTTETVGMPAGSPAVYHSDENTAQPLVVPTSENDPVEPSNGGSTAPAATSSIDLGVLSIKGREIRILNNISDELLKKAPCWVPTSAMPGNEGMCLIYGHRNRTHLQVLKDVALGDDILFTYQDGRTAEYVVSEVIIHEKTSDWTHPVIDGDTMVLVTCYPFVYSGNAPGKAMVVARMKGAVEDAAPTVPDGDYITRRMKITYYCPCKICNGNTLRQGKWGAYLQEGMVASKDLPRGTKVIIAGKTYVVEDRCGIDDTIDIFVDRPHAEVSVMGAYWAEVEYDVK